MPHMHVQASDGTEQAALVIGDEDRDTIALMPAGQCPDHPEHFAMISALDATDGDEVRVWLSRIDLLALVEKGQALLEGRLT